MCSPAPIRSKQLLGKRWDSLLFSVLGPCLVDPLWLVFCLLPVSEFIHAPVPRYLADSMPVPRYLADSISLSSPTSRSPSLSCGDSLSPEERALMKTPFRAGCSKVSPSLRCLAMGLCVSSHPLQGEASLLRAE